jgi:hypothetical protein
LNYRLAEILNNTSGDLSNERMNDKGIQKIRNRHGDADGVELNDVLLLNQVGGREKAA